MTDLHHTPGPWAHAHRRVGIGYATEVFDQQGQTIATLAWHSVRLTNGSVATDRDANARLIAQAPGLLAHAKKSLCWLLGERDCLLDGCAKHDGAPVQQEDIEALAALDRDIDELRDLIAAATAEDRL